MTELETLVVPEELGKWLDSMEIDGSKACFITTINALLFYYWDTTTDSSTSRFIAKNEKEIIEVIIGSREYRVEEPLYYALIKGHELVRKEDDWAPKYWKHDIAMGDTFPSNRQILKNSRYFTKMSKSEWNKLGINDLNADFVKIEEMKE